VNRGFPKTSVFGKATLDLGGKAGARPIFPEHFLKPTGFWEMLNIMKLPTSGKYTWRKFPGGLFYKRKVNKLRLPGFKKFNFFRSIVI
jgi:hypothetical protein